MANEFFGLADFRQIGTMPKPFQLFAGEWQVATESAPALAAITKHQLCAITATGITPFVVATHTPAQAVIAGETTAIGQQTPYWNSGKFNWAAIGWPAGVSLDSLAEVKAAFNGANIQFAHVN